MIVIPSREQVVDWEDQQATVSVNKNQSDKKILGITTKAAYQAWLSFVGMAWDAAGEPGLTTWYVTQDETIMYQLQKSTVQIAAPEQALQELTPWIRLYQQSTVKVYASVGAITPASINVTARLKIYYTLINTERY